MCIRIQTQLIVPLISKYYSEWCHEVAVYLSLHVLHVINEGTYVNLSLITPTE